MDVSLKLLLPLTVVLVGGVLGGSKYNSKENRWHSELMYSVVENVDLVDFDMSKDAGELSFPQAVHVEFRKARFQILGVELFRLLGDTECLTLRGGFTREIVFWSESVEALQVLNTELVVFDVLEEPNYSLKQLEIRSPLFSRWSPSMKYLMSLEGIEIAYCNFTYFDLDLLGGLKNLTYIDLSFNKLQALNSGPFLKLNKLKHLYLQGNQLEFLWRFPDVVPELKYIELSKNRWLCNWVTMARNEILLNNITLRYSDYNCEAGWENTSGLCCRRSRAVTKVEISSEVSIQRGRIDILVKDNDTEMKAIEAEIDRSGVGAPTPV